MEKKLIIIALLSFAMTMTVFMVDPDPVKSGVFNSVFEIFLMTGLLFLVIAINFFAISFFIKKIRGLF